MGFIGKRKGNWNDWIAWIIICTIKLGSSQECDADEILPNLYLGGYACSIDTSWRQARQIQAIANLCIADSPWIVEDTVPRWQVVLYDADVDTSNEKLAESLHPGTQFLHDHLQAGRVVLVHCQQGRSRSASLVLAYMVRFHDMTLARALAHLKRIRPDVRPNHGFMRTLLAYEQVLRGEMTLSLPDYPPPLLL